MRVLQRPAAQRPSHRVVLTAGPPRGLRRPARAPDPRPRRSGSAREARTGRPAPRCARAAEPSLGVVALLVAGGLGDRRACCPGGRSPSPGPGWAACSRAAPSPRQRVAGPRPPILGPGRPCRPRAHRVATEVFDDRVARLTRSGSPCRLRRPSAVDEAHAVAADEAPLGGEPWTPVDVPGPVYASKPVSHRPPALPWSMPAVRPPQQDAGRPTPQPVLQPAATRAWTRRSSTSRSGREHRSALRAVPTVPAGGRRGGSTPSPVLTSTIARGCGAAGSAPRSQRGGQGFESPQLHPGQRHIRPVRAPLPGSVPPAKYTYAASCGPSKASPRRCSARTVSALYVSV